MVVAGLQKTSLVDYPGYIASTIFVGGCNYACPYCHNKTLLNDGRPHISIDEVLEFLNDRKHFTDSVVVTGGEPTLYVGLPSVLQSLKKMGLRVKLDTNGTNPEMLENILTHGLVDYIAMDIKDTLEKYPRIAGVEVDTLVLQESIAIIKQLPHYEFRTTVIPDVHTQEDIYTIIDEILGCEAKRYALQRYKPQVGYIQKGWTAESWKSFTTPFTDKYSFCMIR